MKKYYDNTLVSNIEMNIVRKNYPKALLLANEYVELYPEDKLANIYLARALGLNGHVEEAIELFEESLLTRFHDRSAYLIAYTWYGMMYYTLGYKKEAIEKLLLAVSYEDSQSNGLAVKARLTLSNLYVELNEFEKAIEIVDIKTLDKDLINNKKSYIYLMMRDYNKAIEYGKKVSKYNNDKMIQMNNLNIGKAYYFLEDLDNAKIYLSNCITVKSKYYYSALSLLGRIAYLQNQYDTALGYANQLIASEDLKEDGYRIAFKIYARLGRLQEAKNALDKIESFIDYHYYNQYYCFITKQFDKALENVPYALCHSTDRRTNELIRSNIALYLRLGKYDEAEYLLNCVGSDLSKPYNEIVRSFIDRSRGIVKENSKIYTARQVYNYDEEETIKHIFSHHLLGDSSKFYDKESIREVLYEMKERIKQMECIPDGLSDRYLVHYDNIGYDESGVLNTLEVIANMGTHDIITIYPLSGTDIYEEEEVVKLKELKKESQIDKFNRRYGIK